LLPGFDYYYYYSEHGIYTFSPVVPIAALLMLTSPLHKDINGVKTCILSQGYGDDAAITFTPLGLSIYTHGVIFDPR
jgi:hypothetical protein